MTFRPKDHREPRQPRTPAQKAATERSFKIFRLRGLWYACLILTGERRAAAQQLVDDELALLGAKPQATHDAERMARWDDDLPANPSFDDDDTIPLPFLTGETL